MICSLDSSMLTSCICCLFTCLILLTSSVRSIELTFELPDNANQCYYEDIAQGQSSTVEMQVVTGGQYDVDMLIESPTGQELYKDIRKQYDSHTFTADTTGTYKVCFSNEFSTFSHKIVYMDWVVGDPDKLPNMEHRLSAMTMLESSSEGIHERMKVMDDYQTHHRLRESTGRKQAEDLNERVFYWSIAQMGIVVCMGVGQVFVLRSFFTDKRTSGY
jgi:hypothetical protein